MTNNITDAGPKMLHDRAMDYYNRSIDVEKIIDILFHIVSKGLTRIMAKSFYSNSFDDQLMPSKTGHRKFV